MIANVTFVCFDCRKSARGYQFQEAPHCPDCGKTMVNIGYRWRMPKKNRDKAWKELWDIFCCKRARHVSSQPGAVLLREFMHRQENPRRSKSPMMSPRMEYRRHLEAVWKWGE